MHNILNEKVEKVKILNRYIHELPFIISIPHSGLYITKEMKSKLRKNVILANVDWYLPELYSFLEKLGFTVIINNISRYVIDCNRNPTKIGCNKYTESLIYTKTTFNKEMYREAPSKLEINYRVSNFYETYHKILKREILEKLKYHDKVYLIDLHSFGKQIKKDIILGNSNGKTMNKELFHYITKLFIDNGFSVGINNPFSGGYITKYYGDKNKRCESLQIELSYKSYIDKRLFHEEELPYVNKKIMQSCKKRLESIFNEIRNIK